MHNIFYTHHLIINPYNWLTDLVVTTLGVGLALAGQELINWFHRKKDTAKFAQFLIKEIDYNLLKIQEIIKSCNLIIEKLKHTNNSFGFPSVFTVSGIALSFRKDVYEAIKQSEQYLNLPPEISLGMSKAYSRLIDINLFVSTMVATWEA